MSDMKRVLIAGGSGLIGKELKNFLNTKGFQVAILSRQETNEKELIFHWDPKNGELDPAAFTDLFAVINLAGSTIIGKRWTDKRKKILYSSRIDSTRFLINKIKEHNITLEHFIQASAMGIFGNRKDEVLTEDSEVGDGFLADLCVDWEKEAAEIQEHAKLSIVRISLYLHEKAFIYKALSFASKFAVATSLGSGKQYVNYTHKDEFNKLIFQILTAKLSPAIYHAVGKRSLNMNDFVASISKSYGRPVWLPNVPAFLLRLVLGEAADALLFSTRIESAKLNKEEFYIFNDMDEAVKTLKE